MICIKWRLQSPSGLPPPGLVLLRLCWGEANVRKVPYQKDCPWRQLYLLRVSVIHQYPRPPFNAY